ncbi:hypothetical protein K435DRAFT_796517 [Dendrothele bispora CBS 962.96]|uniref:Uncharacterized protein n=1 Tax=Dendrothele bispora (strain CBS 962.96) TaxID=1314807 RepID=A0A4S8M5Q1_DENBC|nr:hypothetical protein K435DRAFT_796517 [Dendrothele bispora CBS 962.96]
MHNFQSAKAFASTTSQPLKFIAHAAVEKAEGSVKVVPFNLSQGTIHTSLSPVQKKIATQSFKGLPKGSSDTLEEIQNMRVVLEPMTQSFKFILPNSDRVYSSVHSERILLTNLLFSSCSALAACGHTPQSYIKVASFGSDLQLAKKITKDFAEVGVVGLFVETENERKQERSKFVGQSLAKGVTYTFRQLEDLQICHCLELKKAAEDVALSQGFLVRIGALLLGSLSGPIKNKAKFEAPDKKITKEFAEVRIVRLLIK